jgi:hypothetical protein
MWLVALAGPSGMASAATPSWIVIACCLYCRGDPVRAAIKNATAPMRPVVTFASEIDPAGMNTFTNEHSVVCPLLTVT